MKKIRRSDIPILAVAAAILVAAAVFLTSVVLDKLEQHLQPCGFGQWIRPKGGYFVSLNTMPGTAKRALALCKEAGVEMTPAGATYPYGIDPQDSNIRIAPSLPPVEELQKAMDVFCTCLKLAALEKYLGITLEQVTEV